MQGGARNDLMKSVKNTGGLMVWLVVRFEPGFRVQRQLVSRIHCRGLAKYAGWDVVLCVCSEASLPRPIMRLNLANLFIEVVSLEIISLQWFCRGGELFGTQTKRFRRALDLWRWLIRNVFL